MDQCVFVSFDPSTYECATQNRNVVALTTSDSDTTGCNFEITVDWGDGTVEEQSVAGAPGGETAATFEHTYDASGTYTIVADGRSLSLGCRVIRMTYTLTLL